MIIQKGKDPRPRRSRQVTWSGSEAGEAGQFTGNFFPVSGGECITSKVTHNDLSCFFSYFVSGVLTDSAWWENFKRDVWIWSYCRINMNIIYSSHLHKNIQYSSNKLGMLYKPAIIKYVKRWIKSMYLIPFY